jgi:uncharacterized protein DUF3592
MHIFWVLLAGVLFSLIAIYLLKTQFTMFRIGVSTTGVVVAVVPASSGNTTYRPLIQFVTTDGQQIIWKCNVSTFWWKNIQGKSMRILYDPQNPQRVVLRHWIVYSMIGIALFCGILCIAAFFGIFGSL